MQGETLRESDYSGEYASRGCAECHFMVCGEFLWRRFPFVSEIKIN